MVKAGVNPEILENIATVTFNDNYGIYKSIHFWNGNKSEKPVLISNLTKHALSF